MKNRVKEIRTAKGWSQAELATQLGVSRQTVNSIEKGRYDPSLPLAFAIARTFGTQIEDIFEEEGGRLGRTQESTAIDQDTASALLFSTQLIRFELHHLSPHAESGLLKHRLKPLQLVVHDNAHGPLRLAEPVCIVKLNEIRDEADRGKRDGWLRVSTDVKGLGFITNGDENSDTLYCDSATAKSIELSPHQGTSYASELHAIAAMKPEQRHIKRGAAELELIMTHIRVDTLRGLEPSINGTGWQWRGGGIVQYPGIWDRTLNVKIF